MGIGIAVLLIAWGLGAPPADVYTMRNRHLEIPILVNEARRAELKDLELFVSTDLGRTWTLAGRETPNQKAFKFHAQSDGQYWFGVCAVDKAGNRDPAELSASSPALLKVLIDTASPVLKVIAAERVGDEIQAAWDTLDAQADPASLRLDYRASDASQGAAWQSVFVSPTLSGQTRFRPLTNGAITLRFQINDIAGSPATVLKDLPGMALTPSAANPAQAPVMSAPVVPVPAQASIQQSNSIAPPQPVPTAPLGQFGSPAGGSTPPLTATDPPSGSVAPSPIVPAPIAPVPAGAAAPETAPGLNPLPARSHTDPSPRAPMVSGLPDFGNAPAAQPRGSLTDVQHVRDKQVAIDFEVVLKGPSGIKRIEVYMTPDEGRTWLLYHEPTQVTSPLPLPLPEAEGIYGFRLVLYSGADQTVGPPRPGDLPDPGLRLLVDRTPPKVCLYPPTIAPGQPNALLLHYSVSDTYLSPNSVSLYWSQQPNGNWQPIDVKPRTSSLDSRLKECTWSLPADLPDRVYLRLTACDQAGNQGEHITRDPVTVDLHKPTARVTGVKGVVTIGQQR